MRCKIRSKYQSNAKYLLSRPTKTGNVRRLKISKKSSCHVHVNVISWAMIRKSYQLYNLHIPQVWNWVRQQPSCLSCMASRFVFGGPFSHIFLSENTMKTLKNVLLFTFRCHLREGKDLNRRQTNDLLSRDMALITHACTWFSNRWVPSFCKELPP